VKKNEGLQGKREKEKGNERRRDMRDGSIEEKKVCGE
jgi:hypothetical protein